jgi:glycosyltransferase involved in cell wall biosynthesis
MTELRLGLNLLFWVRGAGGSGTYARELLPRLLKAEPRLRVTAFVGRGLPEDASQAPWADEIDWIRFPLEYGRPGPVSPLASMSAQWLAVPLLGARRRLHLLHGLAMVAPPIHPRVATVVTVLDLIWMRQEHREEARRFALGMAVAAPASARRADRVIAISEATKRSVVDRLGVPAERVDVTPLGVGPEPAAAATPEPVLRARLGIAAGPVVLCVAQKREHKNLDALIRVLPRLPEDVQLVLVGQHTPLEDELRMLAEREGVGDRVRFPGWLDEAALEGLYALASCFVLPSWEEGFGLPVLEAMRRGVPVACSNAASLPEVVGDAALLFDPASLEQLTSAVRRLLEDRELAAELVRRGHERCREFTWERTAQATLHTYRRALEQRRR